MKKIIIFEILHSPKIIANQFLAFLSRQFLLHFFFSIAFTIKEKTSIEIFVLLGHQVNEMKIILTKIKFLISYDIKILSNI